MVVLVLAFASARSADAHVSLPRLFALGSCRALFFAVCQGPQECPRRRKGARRRACRIGLLCLALHIVQRDRLCRRTRTPACCDLASLQRRCRVAVGIERGAEAGQEREHMRPVEVCLLVRGVRCMRELDAAVEERDGHVRDAVAEQRRDVLDARWAVQRRHDKRGAQLQRRTPS